MDESVIAILNCNYVSGLNMPTRYGTIGVFVALVISGMTIGITQSDAQSDQMNMSDSMSSMNMTGGSAISATSPPAIYTLPNSSIQVKMTWEPESINTNDTTKFTFEFIDTDTEQRVQNVSFSVHMSLDGKSMGHAHEATAPEGIGIVEQMFDSMGSLSIVLESIKVGTTPITDTAQFSLNVVPEFPIGVALVAGIVIGAGIAASRLVQIKR